ncbi:histone-like nucleoid-structuring protein Lsr2 [Streptomyces sp. NPDC023588]|uniref:Lsr2 family DNA-binding protein n=1 Tax=Streptomyces sp. NPDC023588 TaxID=3154907 RepID=UPI0033D3E03C
MTDPTALTRLCPPPQTQPAPIDWGRIEAELDMRLPEDYKQLAAAYGPGSYGGDYITIYHPHGVTLYVNLTGPMSSRIREYLQRDYDQGTYPVPYDPQHLFAIGGTEGGQKLFWITEPVNAPDSWRVAINEDKGSRWFTYDGNLTNFLVAVISGEIDNLPFSNLLGLPACFTPSVPPPFEVGDPPMRAPVDTEDIRNWARANGFQVPPRGRIPRQVREAWEQAHPI